MTTPSYNRLAVILHRYLFTHVTCVGAKVGHGEVEYQCRTVFNLKPDVGESGRERGMCRGKLRVITRKGAPLNQNFNLMVGQRDYSLVSFPVPVGGCSDAAVELARYLTN